MCPLTMATDWGGCLWSVCAVSPMQFGRKPLSSAFRKVDKAGENNEA
jgi:hypothetical protein